MLNYAKLMSHNPTKLGGMMNDLQQKIDFYEHPTKGDEAEVIAVSHELELASYSTFYDLDDMTALHGEYQPSFQDGKFFIGKFES
jgi:hypothetical protein